MTIKRLAILPIFITVLAFPCIGRADVPDQVNAALAVFNSYCLTASPEFAAIERRATAAGYKMFLERSTPPGPGESLRQKNWLVPFKAGPIMLSAEDSINGPLHAVVCGIATRDVDGSDAEAALSADPRLGTPMWRIPDSSGTGSWVTWLARLGPVVSIEDSQVVMTRDLPGQPSVIINFVFRTHFGR
jgi:hypothetical protein